MKENYWIRGEANLVIGSNTSVDSKQEEDLRWSTQEVKSSSSSFGKVITNKDSETCSGGVKSERNNNNNNTSNNGFYFTNRHKLDADKTGKLATTTVTKNNEGILQQQQGNKDKQRVQAQQQQVKKEENEVNLSFCGCGFLAMYHVGVASCFHEYAPQLSMHKIAGSSAGALVAVSHICGNLQLAYATTDILRVAIDARSRILGPFHPSFDINATVREALERGLPDDVHIKASGKLHVSLTRVYDGKNVIVSQFESKEEVIQVLICSCYIPIWSGLVAPKFRGVTYIDGGFSNNLLILDDKTVTVSPFAGEADICPRDDSFNLLQISLCNTSFSLTPDNLYRFSHALLPPPPEILNDLCEQGFADGIRFLQQMKLISCTKCLEIRSSLLVTANGEDMEEAFVNEVHAESMDPNSTSFNENHHIRLEQQEQKMIEINGNSRRNSVVSTTNQIYQQQAECSSSLSSNDSATTKLMTSKTHTTTTTTTTTKHFFGGEYDDIDNCDECVLMRQRALCDPLPKQFSDRIRDACDTVNKSLSNWIYSHRPIKYLFYLAAPYYLPIEISLALIYKCWKRLPFIRSELASCVYEIAEFIIAMLKRINSGSTTSILLMSGLACRWEEDAIEYEKEMTKLQNKSAAARKLRNSMERRSTSTLSRSSSSTSLNKRKTSCCSMAAASCGAASCDGSEHSAESFALKITTDGVCVSKLPKDSRSSSQTQLHSLEDTFDSIVDVTSNQEARIFAYYFRDAKNRLQITEIFDLERAATSGSKHHHHHQQQQQDDRRSQ